MLSQVGNDIQFCRVFHHKDSVHRSQHRAVEQLFRNAVAQFESRAVGNGMNTYRMHA